MNNQLIYDILILMSLCLIAWFHSGHDALIGRKDKISWIATHKLKWLSRDIPLLLMSIALLVRNKFYFILPLLIHSFHSKIKQYYENRNKKYYGEWIVPNWYKKIRIFWSWWYGFKK